MSLTITEKKIHEIFTDSKSLTEFIEYFKDYANKENYKWEKFTPDQRGEFFYKCLSCFFDEAICKVIYLLDDSNKENDEWQTKMEKKE